MEAVDIFYENFTKLDGELKRKLSVHDIRSIWNVMAKPAMEGCAEIELGQGSVEVTLARKDGLLGVLLRQDESQHDIGSIAASEDIDYVPTEKDVIIWITNPESGRILRDEVQLAINTLEGNSEPVSAR